MKKLFYLLLLALPVFITSCSDEEDEDTGISSFIIGSWVYEDAYGSPHHVTTFYDNGTYAYSTPHDTYGNSFTFDKGIFRLENIDPDGDAEYGIIYMQSGLDSEWDNEQQVECYDYVVFKDYLLYFEGETGGYRRYNKH